VNHARFRDYREGNEESDSLRLLDCVKDYVKPVMISLGRFTSCLNGIFVGLGASVGATIQAVLGVSLSLSLGLDLGLLLGLGGILGIGRV
jgi:hypothetical protein